ncbi:hypothetical protein ACQKEX_14730 [Bacillus pumilus]|uniref:hypothetical protein n=1 Tax=Bacillus TaxID=1386 RepID=UPI000962BEB2|nr:hypothetical protein [Bacillus pumilus]MBU8576414.1 hypothetical protein [Bacillus pumilus]OLP64385.1 hypothetical protein BACPU_26100 [Bacillus pumilus]
MDIQVTPDYKIVSDRLNITVRHCYMADPTKAPNWKEREAKGESPDPVLSFKDVAYCRTVEMALKWIMDQSIRDSEATTISELLKDIKSIKVQIDKVLNT